MKNNFISFLNILRRYLCFAAADVMLDEEYYKSFS